MSELSHYSSDGQPVMVDISEKAVTKRTARAVAFISCRKETIELIEKHLLPKGDPFQVAKIAGIMAAKKTAEIIPLCHPLSLSFVDVTLHVEPEGIRIYSDIRLEAKTGAEMEALVAVSVAALTVYDMCKAVDSNMVIENIRLIEKTGGKSGFKIRL